MGDPVNSFEIMGTDLKKLSAFYQEAFAWKLGSPRQAYTMAYPREDLPVAGVLFQARPGQRGHAMFYVQVRDIDAKLAQIERLGGKTVLSRTSVPDGPTIGQFADPEGNVVGLWIPPAR